MLHPSISAEKPIGWQITAGVMDSVDFQMYTTSQEFSMDPRMESLENLFLLQRLKASERCRETSMSI